MFPNENIKIEGTETMYHNHKINVYYFSRNVWSYIDITIRLFDKFHFRFADKCLRKQSSFIADPPQRGRKVTYGLMFAKKKTIQNVSLVCLNGNFHNVITNKEWKTTETGVNQDKVLQICKMNLTVGKHISSSESDPDDKTCFFKGHCCFLLFFLLVFDTCNLQAFSIIGH